MHPAPIQFPVCSTLPRPLPSPGQYFYAAGRFHNRTGDPQQPSANSKLCQLPTANCQLPTAHSIANFGIQRVIGSRHAHEVPIERSHCNSSIKQRVGCTYHGTTTPANAAIIFQLLRRARLVSASSALLTSPTSAFWRPCHPARLPRGHSSVGVIDRVLTTHPIAGLAYTDWLEG